MSSDISRRYFDLSLAIERAKADRDFQSAVAAARATYPILDAFVRDCIRQYGRFDIVTSHAVHTAPALMAVLEDREGIRELRAVLEAVPELRDWLPAAKQAEDDVDLVVRLMAAVYHEPGLPQSSLKHVLLLPEGRRVALLAGWLEKAGRIKRVKKGATHLLYPAGSTVRGSTERSPTTAGVSANSSSEESRPSTTQALVLRSRSQRSPMLAQQIDIEALPYVRLPKAPARWEARPEEQPAGGASATSASRSQPLFVTDATGWQITTVDKLAAHERPDSAYRDVFPTAGSTFWLDSKGHREGFEEANAVLRVTDRRGAVIAERGLPHDVYRSDVNTDGSAILFMSREGTLHGYSDRLEPLVGDQVLDIPEYGAQAERLGIDPRELRNHVRCVAISADRSRYLVTLVDEAWCFSIATGEPHWGVRFPTQEGWKKVATPRSARSGTGSDVNSALRLMELELPLTPEQLTRQYRRLAMRWHPDRNPNDSEATRRFQDLTAAMELLSGADLSDLDDRQAEAITYEKILRHHRVDVDADTPSLGTMEFTLALGGSEKQAADWIYAANFGASGNGAYLAGYSGRAVEVSAEGTARRVYDLGAVPRQIIDAGAHLNMLTDTRLYVLAGEQLVCLADVWGQGNLIVGETGFGLLQPKAFSWYEPRGLRLGGIESRDPIRRVFSPPGGGLVVETRQHRATVMGAPTWWSD